MLPISTQFATWPWVYWSLVRPQKVALTYQDQDYTWQQLSEKVECYAKGLVAQGIQQDDLIATYCYNNLDQYWLMLAALRIGARFVALNPRFTHDEIRMHVKQLNIAYFWQPKHWQPFELKGVTNITLFLDSVNNDSVNVEWQMSRPATYILTSGSSGKPKAAVLSVENHLTNAEGILSVLPFSTQDSWLLSLPLYHISGQAIVWRCMYRGARLVVPEDRFFTKEIHKVTHASLVPTQLLRLLDKGVRPENLKLALLGGAHTPPALTQQAKKVGIDCWCGYGMTEMGSTITLKKADESITVGQVIPNREVKIVNGEIWARGAGLCLGYFRFGAILPIVNSDGWYQTHDRGEIINGELYIYGRIDNVFISGGENIQPEEIEKVLLKHPSISQAFVFPIEDKQYGHRPVAVIETEMSFVEEQYLEMSNWLSGKLSKFKHPDAYYQMPKRFLSSGIKPSRYQIKMWLMDYLRS